MCAWNERLLTCRGVLFSIWMGLCMTMVVNTVQASAGQVTFRGTVLESEAGIFLETDQGDFFLLQGIDPGVYMDVTVIVTGDLGEDELGNDVILVRTIREEKSPHIRHSSLPGKNTHLQCCDA
jgi:hypothetical protein